MSLFVCYKGLLRRIFLSANLFNDYVEIQNDNTTLVLISMFHHRVFQEYLFYLFKFIQH